LKIKDFNIKSIVIVLAITMLLSCTNDVKEVDKYNSKESSPTKYGKDLVMLYSDSLVLKYKLKAKEYSEILVDKVVCNEFTKGMFIEIFEHSVFKASIKSEYAIYDPITKIWTARYAVEVILDDGSKLNTELLYWDQSKDLIYSDKYVRVTSPDGQVMEGNNGFNYEQSVGKIILNEVTGDLVI
jgi:hypothetical protein